MNKWKQFVDAIDYFKLFRRISFIWVLWLTTECFLWAMGYLDASNGNAAAAALVAAVLTPISGVQAWVLKIYLDNSLSQIKFSKEEKKDA